MPIEFNSVFDTFGALKPLARYATIEVQMLPLHSVFDENVDSSGNFVKNKNRIVNGGNWFDKPSDFLIASSTARSSTIFLARKTCAKLHLKITVWDIKSAYLYAKVLSSMGGILPSVIRILFLKFIFNKFGMFKPMAPSISKLRRLSTDFLKLLGFGIFTLANCSSSRDSRSRPQTKSCFYVGRSLLIVLAHVDDMLVACNNEVSEFSLACRVLKPSRLKSRTLNSPAFSSPSAHTSQ